MENEKQCLECGSAMRYTGKDRSGRWYKCVNPNCSNISVEAKEAEVS